MPSLLTESEDRWQLRLQFLNALKRVAPKVMLSFLEGPCTQAADIEIRYVVPNPYTHDFAAAQWNTWPPEFWRKACYRDNQAKQMIAALENWARTFNLTEAWLLNYFLRLCYLYNERGPNGAESPYRKSQIMVPVVLEDPTVGQHTQAAVRFIPKTFPLWMPSGVFLEHPTDYVPYIRELQAQADRGEAIDTLALPNRRYVGSRAEYLEIIDAWAQFVEEQLQSIGLDTTTEKRNSDHFDWLVLRVCGAAGPQQIQKITRANRNPASIGEAVVSLATAIGLSLPSASKEHKIRKIVSKLGYKK